MPCVVFFFVVVEVLHYLLFSLCLIRSPVLAVQRIQVMPVATYLLFLSHMFFVLFIVHVFCSTHILKPISTSINIPKNERGKLRVHFSPAFRCQSPKYLHISFSDFPGGSKCRRKYDSRVLSIVDVEPSFFTVAVGSCGAVSRRGLSVSGRHVTQTPGWCRRHDRAAALPGEDRGVSRTQTGQQRHPGRRALLAGRESRTVRCTGPHTVYVEH